MRRRTDGKSGRAVFGISWWEEGGADVVFATAGGGCEDADEEACGVEVGWDGCAEGAGSSAGASRLEMSSPGSARRAMIFPTGMPFVPSGA